jgi:hypothetical protein
VDGSRNCGPFEEEVTMRKLSIVLALAGALALPAAASAHPSENRAEQGFGGGPHCHFNTQSNSEESRSYPSHAGHAAQNAHRPGGAVFEAAPCD